MALHDEARRSTSVEKAARRLEHERPQSDPVIAMRYVIGLSAVLGVLTWRSADVAQGTDFAVQALGQLLR